MHKLLMAIALLTPFVLAEDLVGRIDHVSGSYNFRHQNGKLRWVLTEDEYVRVHPCHWASVCECWLEEATLLLSVNCSRRNLARPPRMYPGTRVYELDLSGNKLQQAPNMTEGGYPLVQRLDLSGNRIKSVHVDLLTDTLEVLLLNNNQITRLDETFLNKLKGESAIKWLDLDNNPLACDCKTAFVSLDLLDKSNLPILMRKPCVEAAERAKHLSTNALCARKLSSLFSQIFDESK